MKRKSYSYPKVLEGGGTAGALIRSVDWHNHSLQDFNNWPSSLCVILGIVLNSQFPMILFWGPDLVCFYNDASIPFLEKMGKHPNVMGQTGEKAWGEAWDAIKSQIDQVMSRGESTWNDKDIFSQENDLRFFCSPAKDETGKITGVLITGQRIPNTYYSKIESNQIFESITDGFLSLSEDWIVTEWSRQTEQILGKKKEEVYNKTIWEVYPEAIGSRFHEEFKKTMYEKKTISFQEYYGPLGKWFEIVAYPSHWGISIYLKDITEQQRLRQINKRTEEISGVAGWEYDVPSGKIFLTPKGYEIYGLPIGQPVNLEINKYLFDEKTQKRIEDVVSLAINQQESYEMELNLSSIDGKDKIVRINGFPMVERGKVRKLYGTVKDVTRQKQKQQERDEIIHKLKMAHKIAKLGYWTYNLTVDESEWTEEVFNIWELSPEVFIPNMKNFLATIHPDDRKLFLEDINVSYPDQNYYDTEHRIITPNGQIKWIRERVTLYRGKNGAPELMEGIAQDITGEKEREKKLLQVLKEKEVLLAEIHHRVKNNLAMVSGMMQLQAFDEENEIVREKLMDSVARIISMASIHEELYKSGSFSKLDFSANLQNLVTRIVEAMRGETKIGLEFELDPVQMNVNQAIPYSLIVNEVVTNILNHAFRERKQGNIRFKMSQKGNMIDLSIEDNGVGLPDGFAITTGRTLGVRLIDILAKQLDADYHYDSSNNGTVFSIQFEKSDIRGIGSTFV